MSIIGWLIVSATIFLLCIAGLSLAGKVRNAQDWLVASRGCGRYLGATAGEAASLGAITIIAMLQAAYVGGPASWWIVIITIVVYLLIAISGWGIYRLRLTGVMTINELLEKRYSKKLRIFCGCLCFISGVLNMGIFPVVTGRFIVYFTQLPLEWSIGNMTIHTIPVITAILVGVALLLVFAGGQISLLFTDFLQWIIMMIMFVAVGISVYRIVNWTDISEALVKMEDFESMVNPLLPTTSNSFGLLFCVWFTIRAFYNVLSWAPNTIKSQSALDAKEARIIWIFSYLRYGSNIGLLFAGVACIAIMKLPAFALQAQQITSSLESISNETVRSEIATPIFLSICLGPVAKGLFLAGMISASISTLDTYLLSWAGVLTQDIIKPLRSHELSPKANVKLLRISVIFIALFVYLFSMLWPTTQYIWMYFAITSSIYVSGAGAVILGALYWPKATEAGAWAAMIAGATLSLCSITALQLYSKHDWWPGWINGMSLSVMVSISSAAVYTVVSLLTGKENFQTSSLFAFAEDIDTSVNIRKRDLIEKICLSLLISTIAAIILTFLYDKFYGISAENWLAFWKVYSFFMFTVSIPLTLWFFIGSCIDMKCLLRKLKD